jgi:hypothetical protein
LVTPRVCITNKKNEHSVLDLMGGHKESTSSSVKKIGNTFYLSMKFVFGDIRTMGFSILVSMAVLFDIPAIFSL